MFTEEKNVFGLGFLVTGWVLGDGFCVVGNTENGTLYTENGTLYTENGLFLHDSKCEVDTKKSRAKPRDNNSKPDPVRDAKTKTYVVTRAETVGKAQAPNHADEP